MARDLASYTPLQEMITRVIDGASVKLAADENAKKEKVKNLLDYEKREHGHIPSVAEEKSEKTASARTPRINHDFIEKLAAACDYIAPRILEIVPEERGVISTALAKLAGGMGVPPAVHVPGSVLKTTEAIGGEQKYKKDKPKGDDAAESSHKIPLSDAGRPGGATQLDNNMHSAPGGGGVEPTGHYPETGPGVLQHLKKNASAAEFYAAALTMHAQEQEKLAVQGGVGLGQAAAALGGRAVDAIGHHGGKALNAMGNAVEHHPGALAAAGGLGYVGGHIDQRVWAKHQREKAEKAQQAGQAKVAGVDALQFILDKLAGEDVFPAQISAPRDASALSGGCVLKNYASGEMPPTSAMPGHSETGAGNEGRELISSNDKAQHYTKGEAKAPVKKQLREVLDHPAMSAKHDSKLRENLQNSDKAGVKIAEAQAAIFDNLVKVAQGGCQCGSQGTCSYCRLQEARKTLKSSKTEKTANFGAGAPGGGGAGMPPTPPSPGGAGGVSKMGGTPPPDCTCGGMKQCEACKRQELMELLAQAQGQPPGGGAVEKGTGDMMGQQSAGMSQGGMY